MQRRLVTWVGIWFYLALVPAARAQESAEDLANQLWSVAGDDHRPDVNTTFIQPFLSYTTPTAWTFTAQTESTYDWEGAGWSVPINLVTTKVVKLGNQLASVGGGVRNWAKSPDSGPEGFGVRLVFTLLFPR